MGVAYVVEAVRTPVGRRNGRLAGMHPIDLGGLVLAEVLRRADADPAAVEDVVFGCVDKVGEQGTNIARSCVLAAGLPESIPATTVDRQCGSSQQALHFAAQAVMSGVHDVVIAGGVEAMSRVPLGGDAIAGKKAGFGLPYSPRLKERYPGVRWSQFDAAEAIARRWNLSRERLDAFAVESHRRATRATEEGRFEREILPVEVFGEDGATEILARDEGFRPDADPERMAGLPALGEGGVLTAGTSSQISDGAAALIVANEAGLKRLGARPRARVAAMALAAEDPVIMLTAPIPATRKVLGRAGLVVGDIDLFEVNEAFAAIPLAWAADTGAPLERTNVNGGAIALGHPLGATGARLMTTLLHELERSGGRWGLQTMCEGGGQANATIVERPR